MSTTFSNPTDSWYEVDQLITILRAWGISYLVGLEHTVDSSHPNIETSAVTLIQRLAQCNEYPQVRDASIALFLLHPELADAIVEAFQISEPEVAEEIAVLTLATLYLQRLWSLRLTMTLGPPPSNAMSAPLDIRSPLLPCFPEQRFEFLWRSRHLPPPAYHDGKWGLVALQKAEQKRTGLPLTFIGDWQNQVDHLLLQEEAKQHRAVGTRFIASYSGVMASDEQPLEWESEMSMRPSVDKASIESFLTQLGRTFRKPARLYLVGGAALVHLGVRPGFTLDIDIQVSGTNEGELIVAIQRLIEQLQINVEFASPGDFMPLPSQWEVHSRYVGRYGEIDVFYFDFCSIALSKIERGNNRDLADVKLLMQQQIITLKELDTAYQEVLAQLGQGRYPRLTPQRFAERYSAVRNLL